MKDWKYIDTYVSLLARNSVEDGVSATEVRNLILLSTEDEHSSSKLEKLVPLCVFNKRGLIQSFIKVFE